MLHYGLERLFFDRLLVFIFHCGRVNSLVFLLKSVNRMGLKLLWRWSN